MWFTPNYIVSCFVCRKNNIFFIKSKHVFITICAFEYRYKIMLNSCIFFWFLVCLIDYQPYMLQWATNQRTYLVCIRYLNFIKLRTNNSTLLDLLELYQTISCQIHQTLVCSERALTEIQLYTVLSRLAVVFSGIKHM